MSIARRVLAGPLLFALLVLATGSTSVSAATPSTVVSAPSAALARVNYLSFLNHYIAYNDTIQDDNSDWQFYSDWDDWDGMASVDLRARNHARTEYRWLAAHAPTQSCFKSLYASHKLEVHYTDLAYGYMYKFHHNANLSAADSGIYWLKKATAQIKKSTAILDKMHC